MNQKRRWTGITVTQTLARPKITAVKSFKIEAPGQKLLANVKRSSLFREKGFTQLVLLFIVIEVTPIGSDWQVESESN